MSGDLTWLLYAAGWALTFRAVAAVRRGRAWLPSAVAANAAFALSDVLDRSWPMAAANTAIAVILLGHDWWNRKGKRAARAVGAKSAALVAGLVERVREAGGAVPEGAGA